MRRPLRLSSATEVIVSGYKVFEHGLAPGGAVVPWIWRLLTIRLALPILAMAATGAACGALWLRYRAPARDRNALGWLGHPVPALALRAGLLVAAAAAGRWLPVGAWFAVLLVLDVIALIWLRLMLQLGLREESAERPIGPDIACPNCGRQTPHHTFCAECGVALRALPKRRGAPVGHPAETRLVTRSPGARLCRVPGDPRCRHCRHRRDRARRADGPLQRQPAVRRAAPTRGPAPQ